MSLPHAAQTHSKPRKRQREEDEVPSQGQQCTHSEPPLTSDIPRKYKKKSQKTSEKEDSTIEQSALLMKPCDAPVPLPKIIKFNPMVGGKKAANRSAQSQEKTARIDAQASANRWLKYAPSYRIPGVKLSELMRRPKNRKQDIDAANDSIARMENVEPDACSAKFVDDETGETLVCVFSHRAPGPMQITPEEEKEDSHIPEEKTRDAKGGPETVPKLPAYPGSDKRTLKYVKGREHQYWDGIPTEMLRRYHQCTQELHSFLPPHVKKQDIRHPSENIMTYSHEPYPELEGPKYVRDGDDDQMGAERTGVTHLVHAWHQQGHPLEPMTHSWDMAGRGSCIAQMSLNRYFVGSRPVALYLSACFQVAFPDYYVKYRSAFEAGVWIAEDPGPWLGRAIVWKLPVRTHMDSLQDEGPAAIFNVGQYTGGKLYFPDLGVKLEYDPGTIVIFLSGQLYRSVSEWKPGKLAAGDEVTPGRVENVFFFPKASFDKLHGKPANWNQRTMTGSLPDVGVSKR